MPSALSGVMLGRCGASTMRGRLRERPSWLHVTDDGAWTTVVGLRLAIP